MKSGSSTPQTTPYYLLTGPELGEKDLFLAEVRASLEKRHGESVESVTLYTFDTPVSHLLAALRNGSLFSAHRLVSYKGVETITKKEEIEALASYLAHPNPEATLVMISEAPYVDKRLEKAAERGVKKVFWELFDNQKQGWITQYFRRAGITVTPEAISALLEMVQNNTQDLRNECDRLAAYFGRGATIEESDIETYIYHSKSENVFTLFDQVAEANLASALEIGQSILDSGEANAVGLLGGLAWQLRRLRRIHEMIDDRVPAQEACLKLGIRAKRSQQSYLKAVKNYSAAETEAIIVLLAQFDAEIRAARADFQKTLFELFLYGLIAKKGAAPEPYRV